MAAVTIGEAANLQDNVVVHTAFDHPTVIGPGVSIGHAAVVHGCTIEADCLIGMNATVLNGAVIGEGSLVAAGTVVLEGTRIPPRSLVAGIPGRVRRQLSHEECDKIKENARIYLDLAAGQGNPSPHAATRDRRAMRSVTTRRRTSAPALRRWPAVADLRTTWTLRVG